MTSCNAPSSSSPPLKGQCLLSNILCHLSFSLDAVCFIVAFWLVDQCTFGSAERQAKQAAEKAKKEEEQKKHEEEQKKHGEEKAGYFGNWSKRKEDTETLLSSSSSSPQYRSDSEAILAIPSDLSSSRATPSLSSDTQSPSTPSPRELHHFQKKILKRQMGRSLRLATILRRTFLASLATSVLFLGAIMGGMDIRRCLTAVVGW